MSSGKWRPFCLGLNVLTVKKNYRTLPLDVSCGVTIVSTCEKMDLVKTGLHYLYIDTNAPFWT